MESKEYCNLPSLNGATGRVNPKVAINALQGVVLVRTVSFFFPKQCTNGHLKPCDYLTGFMRLPWCMPHSELDKHS